MRYLARAAHSRRGTVGALVRSRQRGHVEEMRGDPLDALALGHLDPGMQRPHVVVAVAVKVVEDESITWAGGLEAEPVCGWVERRDVRNQALIAVNRWQGLSREREPGGSDPIEIVQAGEHARVVCRIEVWPVLAWVGLGLGLGLGLALGLGFRLGLG